MGPIHDTLRDFLVHPKAATRRLMRELEPHLEERSEVEDASVEEVGDDEEEDDDEETGDDVEEDGGDVDVDGSDEEEGGGDDEGEVEGRQMKKQKLATCLLS